MRPEVMIENDFLKVTNPVIGEKYSWRIAIVGTGYKMVKWINFGVSVEISFNYRTCLL
ncbi:MAG: hypothetical protein MUP82_00280 [Candidatus Marinimicrobia bacterium]|nr:hypothetical protein [Candidatus Neomarinimicrobiota bacterium]